MPIDFSLVNQQEDLNQLVKVFTKCEETLKQELKIKGLRDEHFVGEPWNELVISFYESFINDPSVQNPEPLLHKINSFIDHSI